MQRLVLLVFALVVLRGLLPPNGFSATVLLFDYEFGLIRRGLMGEVANLWWGAEVSRGEVFALSAGMSLFGLVTLYILAARAWFGQQAGLLLALALFTSIAFGALVGATGYMDLVLIGLVGLSTLTNPRHVSGVMARCGAVALGMFLHEILLGYFTIFLMAEIWLRGGGLGRGVVPLFTGVVVLGILSIFGGVDKSQIPAFLEYIDAKSAFTPDPEATVVIERQLLDNLSVMAQKRAEMGYRAWVVLDGLPLLAMSLWIGWLVMRGVGSANTVGRVIVAGALLAPWTLNAIAFDVVRFGAISVLCGFLLAMSLWSDPSARARMETVLTMPHMLCVIVLNQLFAVTQLNVGEAHIWALPWVFLKQLGWF